MQNKRIILIVIAAFLIAGAVIGARYVHQNYGRYAVHTVFLPPEGYLPLHEIIDSSDGAWNYMFWEEQITFLDEDNTCFFQTSVKNKDFIVKYKGAYYITKKYAEMFVAYGGGNANPE